MHQLDILMHRYLYLYIHAYFFIMTESKFHNYLFTIVTFFHCPVNIVVFSDVRHVLSHIKLGDDVRTTLLLRSSCQLHLDLSPNQQHLRDQ